MPNLVLTYRCNNACPFCFNDQRGISDLSLNQLSRLLPFIRSFQRQTIHLVGGEPTLNPWFLDILSILMNEGYRVMIFTNGKMKRPLVDSLQQIMKDGFSFCVNRSDPQLTPEIIEFYCSLGYRIQLATTVYQINQPLAHLIKEIETYHLRRIIRIGIALPAGLNASNQYCDPNCYPAIASDLMGWIQACVRAEIKVSFDCGFPFCFFNQKQRDYLEKNGIKFISNCGFIPDITPDAAVIPCFPLARYKISVSETDCWQQIENEFQKITSFDQPHFLYPHCKECEDLINGNCSGGCRAFRV